MAAALGPMWVVCCFLLCGRLSSAARNEKSTDDLSKPDVEQQRQQCHEELVGCQRCARRVGCRWCGKEGCKHEDDVSSEEKCINHNLGCPGNDPPGYSRTTCFDALSEFKQLATEHPNGGMHSLKGHIFGEFSIEKGGLEVAFNRDCARLEPDLFKFYNETMNNHSR
mmetsp:Transcript_2740/g.6393  ORF Transcript_2740/g.6393 Transcript_2740/m.6393 type:complete len:167 (+) Transcript_2740:46-546(+)